MVFFYTTEVINYQQRVEAFQFNLVAERMPRLRDIKKKVKFYSYDVWENGDVPEGIPPLSAPPPDIKGDRTDEHAGLPAIYFFPLGQKQIPYTMYKNVPTGANLIKYIIEMSP